jgi:hypothetical protein
LIADAIGNTHNVPIILLPLCWIGLTILRVQFVVVKHAKLSPHLLTGSNGIARFLGHSASGVIDPPGKVIFDPHKFARLFLFQFRWAVVKHPVVIGQRGNLDGCKKRSRIMPSCWLTKHLSVCSPACVALVGLQGLDGDGAEAPPWHLFGVPKPVNPANSPLDLHGPKGPVAPSPDAEQDDVGLHGGGNLIIPPQFNFPIFPIWFAWVGFPFIPHGIDNVVLNGAHCCAHKNIGTWLIIYIYMMIWLFCDNVSLFYITFNIISNISTCFNCTI